VLRGEALGWTGAAVCATALFLFTRAPQEAAPAQVQNPIPPSGASVQVGRALYQAYCATCHGEGGRGDGAQAASLPYPPFDLVQHVPLHPDAEVFRMITDGRPDRGMPPWGCALDDEEVWHLVNFLRAQAQEAAGLPGAAAE